MNRALTIMTMPLAMLQYLGRRPRPDEPNQCHFMAALGYAGLHDEKQAQQHLCQARQLDINNIALYKYLLIEGKQL